MNYVFVYFPGDTCSVERRTMIKVFKKKNLICFSGKAISECGMDCNSEATTVDREMVIFIKYLNSWE